MPMRTVRPQHSVRLLSFMIAVGCGTVCTADTVVVRWNDTALECVRQSKIGPPMVARALGIVHTCIYDAWAVYDPIAAGPQSGGPLRRPPAERIEANKAKAISFAAYHSLVDLFPGLQGLADQQMAALGYDPADDSVPAQIG